VGYARRMPVETKQQSASGAHASSLQVPSGALLLDSAFEDAPLGISVVRASDSQRLRVNRAFCEFLGYTRAELLQLPLAAVVHPDDLEDDLRDLASMRSGTISSVRRTKRYRHKSGRVLWGDFSATLIRDAEGKPSHYVSLVADATARVEAERQWKEAQEVLSLAAQLGKLGGWTVSRGEVRGRCSPAAAAFLGVDLEPTWQEVLERFALADRPMVERHYAACVREGIPADIEAKVQRPDGSHGWLRLVAEAERGADGQVCRIHGAVQDITASKRAQLALSESQRAMSALLSNLPGMAFRARDLPGKPYLFASEGALALTGYKAEQLMRGDPTFGSLIHPEDLPSMCTTVQQALDARERFQLTYRICTPHGVKYVWEQGCGVYAEDGRVRCIEGFVTDVTELWKAKQDLDSLTRTLEEQVQHRTAQLVAANAELEVIAYSIAHDLRAPLTTIAGFAQVLEPALQRLQGREAHFLSRILSNVQRMQEQTDALLSLARLSGVEASRQTVDLSALAQMLLTELQQREPGRCAELHVQPGLLCSGDPSLLKELMANLLENAWKFSRGQPQTWIEVGACVQDGATTFHVRDRGAGFDMSHAQRLFTPFARLHRSAEFEGTGIGLALVHKIVRLHGGRVWAHSRVGEGTTIQFTLGIDRG